MKMTAYPPSSSTAVPSRSDYHTFRVVPFHSFSLFIQPAFSTGIAKRKVTAEKLLARAKSNGYERGAHREKGNIRDGNKYKD